VKLSPSKEFSSFAGSVAERQYTRGLVFSSIGKWMSLVVRGDRPSINVSLRPSGIDTHA
jgi:hypothetical protein